MKKPLLLSACLWALSCSPGLAQTGSPASTVVRLSENNGHLVVVRPGGQATEITFQVGVIVSSLTQSGQTMQAVLLSLYKEGYDLKSTTSINSITTMVFIRQK